MTTDLIQLGDPSGILRLLRDGRPRTRAELAGITGQARSTVAERIDRLLASGVVTRVGEALSTGGRPPIMFAFNPASRIIAAIDVGATHARVAITDLASTTISERLETIAIDDGPAPVLERVAAMSRELIANSGRRMSELAGVGLGLPGPVDHSTGRPMNPPIMPGWDDADVAGMLTDLVEGAPVLVDNDVNLMALGEHRTEYPEVDHLLFVKVATGVGAGLIVDGEIRRGAQGAAGDLGHVAVPGGRDVACRCGNTGCLEALVSGGALAAEITALGLPTASSSEVVMHARSGDARASAVLREAGRDLGRVLATAVSLLNPSVIVIGGRMSDAGEHLLAGVREIVYGRSLPLATHHLRIVASHTAGRAGVLGASTMVADHVLSREGLDDLI